jgi:coenzyme F420-0:L-glutamate ligase/coenzyme F420-1:gamma-L-glutamate ligase
MINKFTATAVENIPDIVNKDDLTEILLKALNESNIELKSHDILVIAHKIFSKAEGQTIPLKQVIPSKKAREYAQKLNKDPRKVTVILNESKRVLRAFKRSDQKEGVMICEHKLGFISANAGVDESNNEVPDSVVILPKNPDDSAKKLSKKIYKKLGVKVGIVITDTFGRPWRLGQVNVAIGIAGIPATIKEIGNHDAWGRELRVTEPAFADELAAASGLLMKKAAKTPLIFIRGLKWEFKNSKTSDIIRKKEEDMFR